MAGRLRKREGSRLSAAMIVGGVSSLRADVFISAVAISRARRLAKSCRLSGNKKEAKNAFWPNAGVRAQEPLDASAVQNQCRCDHGRFWPTLRRSSGSKALPHCSSLSVIFVMCVWFGKEGALDRGAALIGTHPRRRRTIKFGKGESGWGSGGAVALSESSSFRDNDNRDRGERDNPSQRVSLSPLPPAAGGIHTVTILSCRLPLNVVRRVGETVHRSIWNRSPKNDHERTAFHLEERARRGENQAGKRELTEGCGPPLLRSPHEIVDQ